MSYPTSYDVQALHKTSAVMQREVCVVIEPCLVQVRTLNLEGNCVVMNRVLLAYAAPIIGVDILL